MHAKSKQHRSSGNGPSKAARALGFSLTELLVVIAIIVLLIGLLLAALAQVRKRTLRTQTEGTMQQFANACAVFQTEHGFYPGVIPDAVIAAAYPDPAVPPISSTENALLHLMGGYRLLTPNDALNTDSFIYKDWDEYAPGNHEIIDFNAGPGQVWRLKIKTVSGGGGVEVAQLGEGPVINGKPYPPYFTPDKNALVRIAGQVDEHSVLFLPDLVDAWGQPIIYVRQTRDRGPLVRDPAAAGSLPQFDLVGLGPYLRSEVLGEQNVDQTLGNVAGSILGIGGTDGWNNDDLQRQVMSVVLNNQTFYKPPPPAANPYYGKARGAFLVLSAGSDGVFFSAVDGPGSRADPLDPGDVEDDIIEVGPKVLEEFDDIRIYGGG